MVSTSFLLRVSSNVVDALSDIAWTIQCYSYSTEILPYDLRTKGLAIFVCVQNLAL
jgi:hypothetical protein